MISLEQARGSGLVKELRQTDIESECEQKFKKAVSKYIEGEDTYYAER
jgi:hypothetical protein